MSHDAVIFLLGISSMGAYASSLLFFRFWRQSRDSLFVFFSAAFALFGLSWSLLALISPTGDSAPYVYSLRLVGFALIIGGTISKNRKPDTFRR
jgi:hypothetical protein